MKGVHFLILMLGAMAFAGFMVHTGKVEMMEAFWGVISLGIIIGSLIGVRR